MTKKINYLLLFIIVVGKFHAQIPSYYNGINFKSSASSVKSQLNALMNSTLKPIATYSPETWEAIKTVDANPKNPNEVMMIYGYSNSETDTKYHLTRDNSLQQTGSACTNRWNREHVFARSLANPTLDTTPNNTDIHNLHAADCALNAAKESKKFTSGSGKGDAIPTNLFYPGDEWKGDVARIMMYMYLTYPSQCQVINTGTGSKSYSPDMLDLFLQWNVEDPPSEFEVQRNNKVQTIQGNRNPFIDNPAIATLIWKGPQAKDNWNILNINEEFTFQTKPTISNSTSEIQLHNFHLETYNYQIFSLNGELISSNNQQKNNKISISKLKSGSYLLKIFNDDSNTTYNFKFLK